MEVQYYSRGGFAEPEGQQGEQMLAGGAALSLSKGEPPVSGDYQKGGRKADQMLAGGDRPSFARPKPPDKVRI